MAQFDIITPLAPTETLPTVRRIGFSDLKGVLAAGIEDFRAMPTHYGFLCLFYPVAGLVLLRATFGYDLIPLLYPLAAGFALLGPFAAIGLYELSRRRELGRDTSLAHVFDVLRSPSLPSILALGALLLALFVIWIAIAHTIYVAYFGWAEPESILGFARRILTTDAGLGMMLTGNAVGLAFAVVAFMLSVISFPLLLDRNVGMAAAIVTSVRVVLVNPLVMAAWALVVAAGLVAGFALFFFGLAVTVPILGHATWHLYRRVVEPDDSARPEYRPRPHRQRYGAEFPASLFFPSSHDQRDK
ncbi:MAG: hypothetical protein RLZ98_94 [Pseudomonadota bacterium]|jgi:uncharacterized membrane protein